MSTDFNWDDYSTNSSTKKTVINEDEEEFNWDNYSSQKPKISKERSVTDDIARNLMQASIGTGIARTFLSPAGIPLAISEVAIPGAMDQALLEEIASEREMPASIKKAIGFTSPEGQSDINYEEAKKAQQSLFNKATGGQGIVGGIVSAPFRIAGIDVEPQTETEASIRFVTEFLPLIKDVVPLAGGQIKKLWDIYKTNFGNIEKKLVGADELPKSSFETAEKILETLKSGETPKEIPRPGIPQATSETPLKGRISVSEQELGLRPTPLKIPKDVNPELQELGNVVSKNKFHNTTEGGKSQKKIVGELDQAEYRKVNKLYDASKQANSAISEIHPNLVNELSARLDDLKAIPELSGPQKQLKTALNKIIKSLAEFEEGQLTGFKPINNQVLIEQIQSLRQKIDYDFVHGNANNIFKPTISDLQRAARNAAAEAGDGQALKTLDEANSAHKKWAEEFDNPYIRPFRDQSNKDYSRTFSSTLNPDEYNMLKTVLDKSPEGKQVLEATQREIVEKYLADPSKMSGKNLDKQLRELDAILTPEQSKTLREKISSLPKAQKAPTLKRKVSPFEKQVSEYLKIDKPEEIQNMFNTRSGIRKLKSDLSKKPNGDQLFDTFSRQKTRSILTEGKIEKTYKGNDLFDVLNKESNHEILSEIHGEDIVNQVRDLAKKEGKKDITKKKIATLGEKVLKLHFIKELWPLLI